MSFGHERLDAYRAAIEYVGWAYRLCEGIKGVNDRPTTSALAHLS